MSEAQNIETPARDAFKDVTATTQKSFEGFTAFNQQNVDAVVKAQTVASKAIEEINAEFVAYSKKSMEEGVAHAKNLAASKTLTEVMDKQAGFARLALDGFVRQSTRMNEMMVEAARGVTEPFNVRFTAAADMMKARTA